MNYILVSTGGTGGLFLGASILSFVELIYIIFLRPFCDIYIQQDSEMDSWHQKFGTRKLEDNKFTPNKDWTLPKDGHLKNTIVKRNVHK